MKILMVNKYLYPKGGAETYMLQLGRQLERMGHEVQYFGMDDPQRCVSNQAELYTAYMDFHEKSNLFQKFTYLFRVIYSSEAYRKLWQLLENFKPNVVHFNNFNYQLTPSVILAADRWRKQSQQSCRLIYTAHDCQLVCPSHLGRLPNTKQICNECQSGHYRACARHKCIHDSYFRSLLGYMEAKFWRVQKIYSRLDAILCCSEFMQRRLNEDELLRNKTAVMHNFLTRQSSEPYSKGNYVLYFGRYSEEKGIRTLLAVCGTLPEISFVFAGAGPLADEIRALPNVKEVGFLQGEELTELISKARFSICPSEWSENCPLSVMESIACGTPVLGARIGGVPELIKDGKNGVLFASGNLQDLTEKIRILWTDATYLKQCTEGCKNTTFDTVEQYAEKLINYYAIPYVMEKYSEA